MSRTATTVILRLKQFYRVTVELRSEDGKRRKGRVIHEKVRATGLLAAVRIIMAGYDKPRVWAVEVARQSVAP